MTAAIDIYPVGVLSSILFASRAIRYGQYGMARIRLRQEMHHLRRRVRNRDWRAVRNSFNGYLAEPESVNIPWTRCGHGWTKRRALADLGRHLGGAA